MTLDTVPFGSTGLEVSELAFGAARFGENHEGNAVYDRSKDTAFDMLDRYTEAGGNFIDTADYYGNGDSERWIGEWLETRDREDFVVASKVGKTVRFDDPNGYGLNRKHLRRQIDKTLERLGTDYVDVLQIHRIDPTTPPESFMRTLNKFVEKEKVNYLSIVPSELGAGAWEPNAWRVARANEIANQRGYEPLRFVQVLYNLVDRKVEGQFLSMVEGYDLGTITYSPLAEGFLTGKYKPDESPGPSTRAAKENHMEEVYFDEENFELLEEVKRVSEEVRATPTQVSLAWLLHNDQVTLPIIGPRTLDQLEENLGAAEVNLSDDQFERLSQQRHN